MSIIGANFVGFTTKQTVTSAAFFLYCVSNIVTPQTFLGEESPRYHTGLAFVLACPSIYIGLSATTWVLMRLENNRRESRARENLEYVSNVEGLSISVEISVFGMYGSGTDAERAVGLLPLLEIGLNSKIYVFPART
ncbi:Pc13g06900 [Penicillium rubens Wisconsin 54-1255]|uniref:Pc13g06900 protein n=1 Tax=Penicillium rubens (strain ATCC 28089 / DSM 1075 / NRRL 1951 / Wisconsin 54-1255) TaxID=500485 RepID=B6H3M4_PENRW|nr:Pc13g06900 [Penicillium rubens Wisconsin 54-1255]